MPTPGLEALDLASQLNNTDYLMSIYGSLSEVYKAKNENEKVTVFIVSHLIKLMTKTLLIFICLIPFLSPLGMLGEAGKSAEMCGDERIRC